LDPHGASEQAIQTVPFKKKPFAHVQEQLSESEGTPGDVHTTPVGSLGKPLQAEQMLSLNLLQGRRYCPYGQSPMLHSRQSLPSRQYPSKQRQSHESVHAGIPVLSKKLLAVGRAAVQDTQRASEVVHESTSRNSPTEQFETLHGAQLPLSTKKAGSHEKLHESLKGNSA